MITAEFARTYASTNDCSMAYDIDKMIMNCARFIDDRYVTITKYTTFHDMGMDYQAGGYPTEKWEQLAEKYRENGFIVEMEYDANNKMESITFRW